MIDENVPANIEITPAQTSISDLAGAAPNTTLHQLTFPLTPEQAARLQINDQVNAFPVAKLIHLLNAHQQGTASEELEKRMVFASNLTATIMIHHLNIDEDGRVEYHVSYEQDRTQNMDIDESPHVYFYGNTVMMSEDFQ